MVNINIVSTHLRRVIIISTHNRRVLTSVSTHLYWVLTISTNRWRVLTTTLLWRLLWRLLPWLAVPNFCVFTQKIIVYMVVFLFVYHKIQRHIRTRSLCYYTKNKPIWADFLWFLHKKHCQSFNNIVLIIVIIITFYVINTVILWR